MDNIVSGMYESFIIQRLLSATVNIAVAHPLYNTQVLARY